jgi:SAM-dependent methyltransferase
MQAKMGTMKIDPRRALAIPTIYQALQSLIGRPDTTSRLLNEILKLKPGEKVLDIGCGPCTLFQHMPPIDYIGMDMSADYIASARAAYGDKGRFLVGAVSPDSSLEELGKFDLIMAMGLLHHVDDVTASSLFGAAKSALKPGGRVVTLDNVFVPEQSLAARTIIKMDRGLHVRDREGYARIAASHFNNVGVTILHDLLRIPYTHIIMECSKEGGRLPVKMHPKGIPAG